MAWWGLRPSMSATASTQDATAPALRVAVMKSIRPVTLVSAKSTMTASQRTRKGPKEQRAQTPGRDARGLSRPILTSLGTRPREPKEQREVNVKSKINIKVKGNYRAISDAYDSDSKTLSFGGLSLRSAQAIRVGWCHLRPPGVGAGTALSDRLYWALRQF